MEPLASSGMGRAERERLFEVILGELAERGYEYMALDKALAAAGVSREAFEAEFADGDACLYAAYDELTERLIRNAANSYEQGADWPQRIQGGLESLLSELAADPRTAQVLIRSFPAIRPAAYGRYMEFLETFTLCLREGRELTEMEGEPPGEIEMLAIGAAEAIVFEEIEAGRARALQSLTPSILFSLLVPFTGPERALAAVPGEVR
jgi:AcrR family transcriptional regulator